MFLYSLGKSASHHISVHCTECLNVMYSRTPLGPKNYIKELSKQKTVQSGSRFLHALSICERPGIRFQRLLQYFFGCVPKNMVEKYRFPEIDRK